MSMGAEHLGVRIQAPIQIQATPISRDCSYCFERRDAIQVSERRSVSSFRKIGDNTPALGSDRTGVLFDLFPDSEERWESSAHPESQEVQSSFKASALPYALSFNPFNVHQTRGLVHNSGSPGCLFPHPNSQGPQKVSPILLSGQRLRVQCSPLRSVIGSPHLHQMYECGTHSSSSPGPTYCQLPGRFGNLLAYRAAGQEQHKGGPSPLAEIRVNSEQQKELSHSHKGGDVPRLEFEFGYNESIPDSTEAVSVEGVPVRVRQKVSCYSEVGSETAWPNGGSLSGGAIGVTSHAPITAMVSKVQSKSIREWTATGSKRPGLSSSSQVVALNSRPEGGSQAGTIMFKGDHNNRCLTGRLWCCLERQSSTRKMGGLMDRRTHKPLGAGGSISGLDTFSSSVSGEAGGCSFRQHNSRVIHKSSGRCTFNIPTQEGSGSPVMGTCSRGVPEGCTLTGRGQCSSRPLVKGGSQARRMATSPSTDTGHLASFREGQSRYFCHTGKHTLSPVVFDGGPQRVPRGGCSGKQMAPSTPVCISTFPTAACSPGQGENVEGQSPAGGTRLASTVMDAGSNRFAERVAMASPSQTGHAVSGPRSDLPAEFMEVQVARLATRRESARNIGEAVLGNTVGFQPLIRHYLKGARRLSPSRAWLIPSWDLGIVLKALIEPPFEPLDEIRMEFLTLKTAFLLAVSSVKRVSEIHAFSVHPACLRLGEEGSSITLLPNPSFLPKVLPRSFVSRPLVLEPFHPPPHNSAESARLHLICPVRALRRCISCTQQIRRSDQLFVCYGDSVQGQAVSKQRLAKWVVRLIELAYHSAGMTPPQGVVAHSTRGVATSWALFRGASLEDVCAAAGWSSSMTFVKFYRLDVATTVASTVLQTAEQA